MVRLLADKPHPPMSSLPSNVRRHLPAILAKGGITPDNQGMRLIPESKQERT